MSAFDTYYARNKAKGGSMRGSYERREIRKLMNKMPDSLSYHQVVIYEPEYSYNIGKYESLIDNIPGVAHRDVAIINTDSLNKKIMYAMPGEDLRVGSIVYWNNNFWLITQRDANDTVQTKVKILQCNYLLKWISKEKNICEQWCAVLDAASTNGEYEDRKFVVTRGDVVISMNIGKNEMVDAWQRETRFIIDDSNAEHKMAFSLTRPIKAGYTYNGDGVYKFILREDTTNDDDNQRLGIADYFKFFPREDNDEYSANYDKDYGNTTVPDDKPDDRKLWL